jgi:uncharacterized membrane protein YeiB
VVWIAGQLLANEKMYDLLSILFGAGVVLMSEGLERRGTRPGPLHYRRMAWLMLFGLLHGHLLWLRRFAFGPLEWLWRALTYWRWAPPCRDSNGRGLNRLGRSMNDRDAHPLRHASAGGDGAAALA